MFESIVSKKVWNKKTPDDSITRRFS